MLNRFTGSAERKAGMVAGVPLKRVGTPEEIAEAIVFFASDKVAFRDRLLDQPPPRPSPQGGACRKIRLSSPSPFCGEGRGGGDRRCVNVKADWYKYHSEAKLDGNDG
jgi:hypothetical protein